MAGGAKLRAISMHCRYDTPMAVMAAHKILTHDRELQTRIL